MGDDQPNQKAAIEQSKLEKAPDRSIDPLKIAEEMARKELEAKQKTETKTVGKEYQKNKAAVEATVDAKKAEVLASTSAKLPEIELLSFAPTEATSTSSPEKPITQAGSTAQPSGQPSESAKATIAAAAESIAAAPASEEKPSLGEQLKAFFYTIFPKELVDFFAKIFTRNKAEPTPEASAGSAQPSPAGQPVEATPAPSNAPAAAASSRPRAGSNKPPRKGKMIISNDPSDPEVLKGPDTTAGLKGQALYNNPQFQARTDQIAKKIGVNRFDLYSIFQIESGCDPHKPNARGSGAMGLIQFMPDTAKGLRTNTEALSKMTGLQQLDWVEKYFARHFGKLHNFADLYRAVFWPASIGRGPDYVFDEPPKRPAKIVAEANPTIAAMSNRPDHYIDNAAFDRYCNRHRPFGSDLPMVA